MIIQVTIVIYKKKYIYTYSRGVGARLFQRMVQVAVKGAGCWVLGHAGLFGSGSVPQGQIS